MHGALGDKELSSTDHLQDEFAAPILRWLDIDSDDSCSRPQLSGPSQAARTFNPTVLSPSSSELSSLTDKTLPQSASTSSIQTMPHPVLPFYDNPVPNRFSGVHPLVEDSSPIGEVSEVTKLRNELRMANLKISSMEKDLNYRTGMAYQPNSDSPSAPPSQTPSHRPSTLWSSHSNILRQPFSQVPQPTKAYANWSEPTEPPSFRQPPLTDVDFNRPPYPWNHVTPTATPHAKQLSTGELASRPSDPLKSQWLSKTFEVPSMSKYVSQTREAGSEERLQNKLHIQGTDVRLWLITNRVPLTQVYYHINYYNEPLNYRKLLERGVSCNWKLVVDRIVIDSDQQASIFLQQKLKIASQEQKDSIIASIQDQAYPLMINRFGNFLVQRCLEYGSPAQVAGITSNMIGRVVALSMDPFGCHVVQKALDSVNEDMKLNIIHEMSQNIRESIIHRYACHVWQKLFELRWESCPPPIMNSVNHELKGMWTEVALGETGSLVVQNIFENCVDQDKRPVIDEVIANMDTIIRGQWGNWVIQHMVENADSPVRETVTNSIIEKSPVYSVDQFASKVVEKMLKMGDPIVIQAFLNRVTQRQPDKPRIPLIDIASDAHGNYLIQYILQHGSQSQKDEVSAQIKKHLVSLRGSKWGSKCAWLIDRSNRSAASRTGFKAIKPKLDLD